ncbi:MAG TPA: aspartate racemase [Clostridiales bacterium]|jgi:aspartate racemase|nr:aspartate racemase [Clostridiales bacterium]
MKNALGVLGGMGPLASQLLYRRITEKTMAMKDQDHIDLILLSHATMPDRTEAILSGETQAVHDLLLQDCKTLELLGCKGIAVACNTAHYFIHRFEEQLNIPVISMIREAAEELAKTRPCGRIVILATDGTIQTGLYQEALKGKGLDAWIPDCEVQQAVMNLIYGCIKKGQPSDEDALKRIDEGVRAAGCVGALLACTELSVIGREMKLDEFYLDPMEVLADRVVSFMDKELRKA